MKLALYGLGSRATAYYLQELNKQYNLKKGGYSTCPLWMYNTNFDTINPLLPNVSKPLDVIVAKDLQEIAGLQPDKIIVPNITLHETIDRVASATAIVHPLPLTLAKIKQHQVAKIVLIGSLHSMNATYLRSFFKENGIAVVLPTAKEMELIDTARKAIYAYTETEELVQDYQAILKKYAAKHIVVIACTELSILKPQGVRTIADMADLQILNAVQTII